MTTTAIEQSAKVQLFCSGVKREEGGYVAHPRAPLWTSVLIAILLVLLVSGSAFLAAPGPEGVAARLDARVRAAASAAPVEIHRLVGLPIVVTATAVPLIALVGDPIAFSCVALGGVPPYTFAWAYGDGGTGSGANTTYAYSAAGIFTATCTVADSASDSGSGSIVVTIDAPPPPLTAAASASPSTANVGDTITFTCSGSGGVSPYSYAWDFGDGSTGSGSTAAHAYGTAGAYTATCTVTDSLGNTASGTTGVTVAALPTPLTANASASPAIANVGETVTFTCSASGGVAPYTYAWDFGDGTKGSGSTATHAYASSGVYTATCTVTDSTSATATATAAVTVNPVSPLSATASASPSTAQVGQTITFTCSASGGVSPYSYAWDFGDGATATGSTASHGYASAGTYTAACTVTDAATSTARASATVTVNASASLTASAQASPTSAQTNQTITFSCTASGGTSPYSFAWEFGDGSTGSGSTATHAYVSPGVFSASCTAADAASKTATAAVTVTISSAQTGVSASIQASRSTADVKETVSFTCTAIGGVSPYTFSWDLGDGTTATGATVSHAYDSPGSMTVRCTVTDSNGSHGTASTTLTVDPALSVTASVDHPQAAPGTNLTFTPRPAGGSGSYTDLSWSFGDGQNGSGSPVTHVYATNGSFTVSVTVTDSNAGTATASLSVTISGIAIQAYESSTVGLVNTTVNFTAYASGGAGPAYTYVWDFGDGITATGVAVEHMYTAAGNYTPAVRAADALGASSTTRLPTIQILGNSWTPGGPMNVTIVIMPAHPMALDNVSLVAVGHGGTAPPTCTWDFGDAHGAQGCRVSHAWSAAGNFTVSVNASDPGGASAKASIRVAIEDPLEVSLVMSPSMADANVPVNLTAVPVGGSGNFSCTWDFGDSVGTVGCRVGHTWTASGTYRVTLAVIDSQGHRVALTSTVPVQPSAGAGFGLGGLMLPLLIAAPVVLIALVAGYLLMTRRSRFGGPADALPTEGLDESVEEGSGGSRELDRYLADLERFTKHSRKREDGAEDEGLSGRVRSLFGWPRAPPPPPPSPPEP